MLALLRLALQLERCTAIAADIVGARPAIRGATGVVSLVRPASPWPSVLAAVNSHDHTCTITETNCGTITAKSISNLPFNGSLQGIARLVALVGSCFESVWCRLGPSCGRLDVFLVSSIPDSACEGVCVVRMESVTPHAKRDATRFTVV